MISIPSFAPSASKPHDKDAKREQNPHYTHYNGLNRIFEAFYRVADSRDRETGGVGLGLAITARIMALHGGDATARNAADGGLIVELRFPERYRLPMTDARDSTRNRNQLLSKEPTLSE
jgi:hypothetical protein